MKPHGIADYRLALGGVGPLAADWRDKPHRLVYDLCARVEALEAALTTERARVVSLRHESGRLRHEPSCSVRVCGSSVKRCSCGRGDGEAALAAKGEPVAASDPVRRACWTCSRNYYDADGDACCNNTDLPVYDWLGATDLDTVGMPPRDADGCPGWAAKS